MTALDADLASYLDLLDGLRARKPFGHLGVAEMLDELAEVGLLDLATDIASDDGIDDVRWLAEAVRRVARESASAAFYLAARFLAQRAQSGTDTGPPIHNAVAGAAPAASGSEAVVPWPVDPELVLLLERAEEGASARLVEPEALQHRPAGRAGLKHAGLRCVRVDGTVARSLSAEHARRLLVEWDLLVGSVALGIGEAGVAAAADYARTRRQFGASIASFAGLRAIIAGMDADLLAAGALMDAAIAARGDALVNEAASRAGDVAVSIAIAAIQVHGGYGYIDEYPVAGYLRDAISVRARLAGRTLARRALATERLGRVLRKEHE